MHLLGKHGNIPYLILACGRFHGAGQTHANMLKDLLQLLVKLWLVLQQWSNVYTPDATNTISHLSQATFWPNFSPPARHLHPSVQAIRFKGTTNSGNALSSSALPAEPSAHQMHLRRQLRKWLRDRSMTRVQAKSERNICHQKFIRRVCYS